MTTLWAGGDCEPCENGRHHRCVGWDRQGDGFCGCTKGLCGLRLITGVLWDVDTEPNGKEHP